MIILQIIRLILLQMKSNHITLKSRSVTIVKTKFAAATYGMKPLDTLTHFSMKFQS